MNCKTCGEGIPDAASVCPACGAERFPARRRRAAQPSGEAAAAYHLQIERGMRGETTRVPRVEASESPEESAPPSPPEAARAPAAPRRREGSAPPRQAEQAAPRRAPSMPPSALPGAAARKRAPARALRRHAFHAIRPEPRGFETFPWVRWLIALVLIMAVLTGGVYAFLSFTGWGQSWLAGIGAEATADAYYALGRSRMAEGYIRGAVEALEIAQAKEPNDLEILVALGSAYAGADMPAEAEVAYARAVHFWPAYPEPYSRLTEMFLEQGRAQEAVALMELAIENEAGEQFQARLDSILPKIPTVDKTNNRYDVETNITLTCEEGAVLHYSLSDEDPLVSGEVSAGNTVTLFLERGGWRLRAVAEKDGIFSKELVHSYSIVLAKPDMPTASLGPGRYNKVQRVTLRGGAEDKIYYTMDGTRPTTESSRFIEGNPITLRVGKTVLRAIAVNPLGEQSNELTREYVCDGNTGTAMVERDTVGGLTLMRTDRAEFVGDYGEPEYARPDGEDLLGSYEKLFYPFGYAVFLTRGEREPVLSELYFTTSAFAGPRDTKIGSTLEEVIGAFRDDGGEPSANGNRVLYRFTTGRLGLLEKISDTQWKVSYYNRLENNQHIELTYYVLEGAVEHIEWRQYLSDG